MRSLPLSLSSSSRLATIVVVAVAAVLLAAAVSLMGVLRTDAHRIVLLGPPGSTRDAVAETLARKLGSAVISAGSLAVHAPRTDMASPAWVLCADDGDSLSAAVQSGEFARLLGRPTHVVVILGAGCGAFGEQEKNCPHKKAKTYDGCYESTPAFVRTIEAAFGPVPVIRADASKTPEDVYAEIRRRSFLEFYAKSTRCGSLCRAY